MEPAACIFGIAGQRLTDSERRFFNEVKPLGFILFSRNGDKDGRIQPIIQDLKEISTDKVLILTDHEGGRVQRFTGSQWSDWIPALDQCCKLHRDDRLRALWLRYRIIATELYRQGINVNCVPVCDVKTDVTHPVLANRCYGSDVEFVCQASREVAEACLSAAVLPVIKHIPGHGQCQHDSHVELPSTDASYAELTRSDFRPFRELNDLPLGMMAHVLYQSVDDKNPASQSEAIISIVRDEIGFDGLLMTDDLAMSALQGAMDERAGRCLAAGCDVILHCNGLLNEMEALARVSGRLSGVAKERADRALQRLEWTGEQELGDLIKEYSAIVKPAGFHDAQ